MDEAGKFTAEHSVMEAGIEIRELKHLLEIKDDKIKKLQAEIVRLKASQRHNITIDGEPLHSVASEKYNKFGYSLRHASIIFNHSGMRSFI